MKGRISKYIFLLLLASVVINGCKEEQGDAAKLLIGKWNQVSLTTVTYLDNVKQNETYKTYSAGEIVLEVYDDGTAKKFVRGVISDAFYWTVDGDLLLMTGNNGIVQTAEFAVNETDLTMQWAVQETSDGHTIRTDYMSEYKRQ
jgi:hypothetical protein